MTHIHLCGIVLLQDGVPCAGSQPGIVYMSVQHIKESYNAAAHAYAARVHVFQRILSRDCDDVDAELVKEAARGVPDVLRGKVWARVLGVSQDRARDLYAECVSKSCKEEVTLFMIHVMVCDIWVSKYTMQQYFPLLNALSE